MKRFFSLVKIATGLVIVGGLVIIAAIPLYKDSVEKAKSKVCEANLRMLLGAVEIYGSENHALPVSLSQLQERHIQKAWAQVFRRENRFLIKLAYGVVDFDRRGFAYAGEFVQKYLAGNLLRVTCPADPTPPPAGISYGLNSVCKGMDFKEYTTMNAQGKTFLVIGDCEQPYFTEIDQLTKRHASIKLFRRDEPYANGILNNRVVVHIAPDTAIRSSVTNEPVQGMGKNLNGWQPE